MRVNTEHFPNTPIFSAEFSTTKKIKKELKCGLSELSIFSLIWNITDCMSKKLTGEEIAVVKINRGGLGLDNTFANFCQIHVKKLDKLLEICVTLKT